MPTVAVDDIEIAFADQGAGIPLLLVHGFPLDHSMWRPVIDRLGDDCRVIAPDLRGYGGTTLGRVDPEEGVSMQRYADDLAGLLDAIGLEEPVVYCGFSMGGYIGWRFLDRYRERVRSLALCDTRAGADSEEARDTRLRMARHVAEWGAERVAEAMLPKLFAASTLESASGVAEETRALIAGCDPRAIAAAQRGMAARPDSTGLLAGVSAPALALVGDQDALTPPAEMESMVAAMPDAELVVIPSAGHMAPVEQPVAVADALLNLLRRS